MLLDPANPLKKVFLILLSLLLFFPPFFRGLYFEKEYFVFLIFALGLFLFYYITNRQGEKKVFDGCNDYAVLGLVAAYMIAVFGAVNTGDAVNSVLKMTGLFAVYYVAAHGLRDLKSIHWLKNALYFSGLGVAIAGLSAALGLVKIQGGFVEGRIYSTLQYPNTLASYLTAGFIIGVYFSVVSKNKYSFVLYSIVNYLIMLAFIGTQSRGALLVFLVILPLFLLGPMEGKRIKALFSAAGAVLIAMMMSGKIFTGTPNPAGLIWVLIGVGFLALVSFGYSLLESKIASSDEGFNLNKKWVTVGLGVILLIGVIAAIKYNILPKGARITSITLSDRNSLERFVFYRDALNVFKDYPVFGAGGGAWKTLFQKYQSYYYVAREVHNYYLQVLIEAGILGFVMVLAIWSTFFKSLFKTVKNGDSTVKLISWTLFCSALGIGIHSLIDFNLSLGAVAIFLWALFGLGRALEALTPGEHDAALGSGMQVQIKNFLIIGSVLVIGIVTSSFIIASGYGANVKYALGKKDMEGFRANVEQVVKFNPLNSPYHVYLAQLYVQMGAQQDKPELMKKALAEADTAVRLNPYDPTVREIRARTYLALTKVDEGIKEMEVSVECQPWYQERWGILAETYYQAGRYYLEKGDKKKAAECFNKVSEVPVRISSQLRKLKPEYKELWVQEPKLQVDAYILSLVAKADSKLNKM